MGIEDLIKSKASSVEGDEKKQFEEYHDLVNPKNATKFMDGDFLGVKGGIGKIASLQYEAGEKVDSMHSKDDKEKLKPEDIRVNSLAHITVDIFEKMKGHKKAQKWVNHWKKLNKTGGFESAQEKEQTLLTMAADIYGWDLEKDKELNQHLGKFLAAAEKGDSENYKSALRGLRNHTEEKLYTAHANKVSMDIASDPLLSQKAQAYFAAKTLKDHKLHVADSENYFKKSFIQHANDYHQLAQIKSESAEDIINSMGYKAPEKKNK